MASVHKREWTHKGVRKTAWIVRYFDEKGKQRQRTYQKKKDALIYCDRVKAELADESHVALAATMSVRAFCDVYLRKEEQRLRDGGIGQGRYVVVKATVNRTIIPFIGNKLLTQLSPHDIEDWVGEITRAGNLSARTARDRMDFLGLMLDYAIGRGLLKKNPVRAARKQLGPVKKRRIMTFTPEQVALIIRGAEARPKYKRPRYHKLLRCGVNLAACCGLRLGEILGLTVPRINFDASFIEVRHSLTQFNELKGPKTHAGNRDVPMPTHLREMLSDWVANEYIANPRQLLFVADLSKRQSVIRQQEFRDLWVALLRRIGLGLPGKEQYHFHALRHFASSWMIASGLPLIDVASLLGHESFDTTLQVYAHPVVGGNRRTELFQKMSDNLLGAPVLEGDLTP